MGGLKILVLAGIVFGWIACKPSEPAPKASKKQTTQTPASPAEEKTNSSNATTLSVASAVLLQSDLTASRSLLKMVTESGKKIGVFQFSGVTCESCKKDSPGVVSGLASVSKELQFFVVFPNRPAEYSPAEYKGFVDTYAPKARFAIDSEMALLKQIRKDDTQFFGLYVLLLKDGSGVVLTDEDAPRKVVSEVKKLLGGTTP